MLPILCSGILTGRYIKNETCSGGSDVNSVHSFNAITSHRSIHLNVVVIIIIVNIF